MKNTNVDMYTVLRPSKANLVWTYTINLSIAVFFAGLFILVNRAELFEMHTTSVADVSTLIDASSRLFNSSLSDTASSDSAVIYSVPSRADIKSFAYDLGGTTCACELKWDKHQYWQRLIYGKRYLTAHNTTAFLAFLFCHRLAWVILWKLLNELLEELALGMFGVWAWVEGTPFDLETRYDSIILDCVLAPVAFGSLCMHMLYVLDIDDPFPLPLQYDWPSVKVFLLPFVWFYGIIQINSSFGYGMGSNLLKGFVQICILWLVFYLQKYSQESILRLELPALRFVSLCLGLIWILLGVDVSGQNDEFLSSMIAFSGTGFLITCYQFAYTTRRNFATFLLCIIYPVFFGLAYSMTRIISHPKDKFYYGWQWCGMREVTAETQACPLIKG